MIKIKGQACEPACQPIAISTWKIARLVAICGSCCGPTMSELESERCAVTSRSYSAYSDGSSASSSEDGDDNLKIAKAFLNLGQTNRFGHFPEHNDLG